MLHLLRRSLPDADRFIEVRPRTLRWLDVAVFERAVAEGRLQEAVEVYRGDLLEGSCDDWLVEERERLAQLHIHALERLVHELQEEGRWSEAIGYAELLVRRDPLREETYRLLMRLWDGSGNRARALRAYHACVAILQRELGGGPSEPRPARPTMRCWGMRPRGGAGPDRTGRAAAAGMSTTIAVTPTETAIAAPPASGRNRVTSIHLIILI